MKRITYYSVLFFILCCSTNLQSQNNQTNCSGEKYAEFDFWIGNWNVYDTKGKLLGTNAVLKMQDNCVLQENWISKVGPSTGTSYNFYNKTEQKWNQIWVDNSGFSLNLKGNFVDGKMVLYSRLIKAPQQNYFNRIVWSKNKDGSVTQVWTYLDESGAVLKEVFRGIYKKE